MKKYKTEGDIDFFNELYKSLDDNEETFKIDEEDDNKCLITNQYLIDKFVKLECGHKFNYIPLFNDIKNHKSKFNSMEGQSTLLKLNEIRCPYCRKKQSSVLPYYEDLLIEKINGVNYYDANSENLGCHFSKNGCQFTYKLNYDNGSYKEFGCFLKHVYNFEDGKQYCFHHHNIMKKLLIKKQNQKIKDDIKNAKIEALNKVKDEKQKVKDEKQKVKDEKQKAKDEKQKVKDEKQKIQNFQQSTIILNLEGEENTIIEPLQQICCKMLKNGIQCTKNVYLESLCKRHYNLKNNENKEK